MDENDPVCLQCISDVELRQQLFDSATRAVCASCGKRRRAVALRDLANRVEEVYRENYEPGEDAARFYPDSDNRTMNRKAIPRTGSFKRWRVLNQTLPRPLSDA